MGEGVLALVSLEFDWRWRGEEGRGTFQSLKQDKTGEAETWK